MAGRRSAGTFTVVDTGDWYAPGDVVRRIPVDRGLSFLVRDPNGPYEVASCTRATRDDADMLRVVLLERD